MERSNCKSRNVSSANCRNRRIDKLIKTEKKHWKKQSGHLYTGRAPQRPVRSRAASGGKAAKGIKKREEKTVLNAKSQLSAREVEIPGNEREREHSLVGECSGVLEFYEASSQR